MWECGLKLVNDNLRPVGSVTPYVGVWIETLQVGHAKRLHCVTPYVGVWIETVRRTRSSHTR